MAEELEATRQRMHEIYPLTEGTFIQKWMDQKGVLSIVLLTALCLIAMWLEWIQDVKATSQDPENRERIKTLYLEAAEDYLCKLSN
jgi:hypothetical protein